MRPLLYTLCYGERYLPVLRTWLHALRGAGRYDGDLVVLTDLPRERFAGPLAGVRPLPARQWLPLSPYYEKTSILALDDLASYDVVLYLDADVVTVNPVRPLFERCARAPAPLLNRSRHDMAWTYNAGALDAEERERVQRERVPGINAGLFGASRPVLVPFLERWRAAVRAHHATTDDVPPAGDQPFLDRMALRGELPGYAFFPEGWLQDWLSHLGWSAIRELRSGHLKLVHLPGPYTPEQKAETMQRLARRAARAKAWYGYLTTDRLWQRGGRAAAPPA